MSVSDYLILSDDNISTSSLLELRCRVNYNEYNDRFKVNLLQESYSSVVAHTDKHNSHSTTAPAVDDGIFVDAWMSLPLHAL